MQRCTPWTFQLCNQEWGNYFELRRLTRGSSSASQRS